MEKNKESLGTSIDNMVAGLNQFVSAKTVVGEPIHIGDTIIIPLVSVSFGMGSGNMGQGAGGGMGGKVSPNSVIVIHNDITRLINISTHSGMDRILDMVPDFVDRFTSKKADKKAKKESVEEDQDARDAAADEIFQKVSDAVNAAEK